MEEQAEHYVDLVGNHLDRYSESAGETGIIVAPFDAELFGHWWFEGPRWLGKVLRRLPEKDISPTTCSRFLDSQPPRELIHLPEGSWGKGGFHFIWLNEWTEWTWKEIHLREERFRDVVLSGNWENDDTVERILKQLARELLLLEASDWQFLISTRAARDYAEQRVAIHVQRFDELSAILETYRPDQTLSSYALDQLTRLEEEDSLFEEIDLRGWRSSKVSGKQGAAHADR